MDIDIHLGKQLRRYRLIRGMTQHEVGDACGVRFQQIHKYECATNRMSAARLWQICQALEVPVDAFFAGLYAEPPTPEPEPALSAPRGRV